MNTDNRGQEATSSDTHRKVDAEVTRMLREAYSRVTSLLVRLLNLSDGGKWQSSALITVYTMVLVSAFIVAVPSTVYSKVLY